MEHAYDVTVTWTGNTGEGTAGYRSYTRDHTIATEGRPELLGSSDPTFRGDRSRWNPELFLLAALSECHLLSYLHVCVMEGVVVTSYVDDAHGSMTTYPTAAGASAASCSGRASRSPRRTWSRRPSRRTTAPTSCASSPTA